MFFLFGTTFSRQGSRGGLDLANTEETILENCVTKPLPTGTQVAGDATDNERKSVLADLDIMMSLLDSLRRDAADAQNDLERSVEIMRVLSQDAASARAFESLRVEGKKLGGTAREIWMAAVNETTKKQPSRQVLRTLQDRSLSYASDSGRWESEVLDFQSRILWGASELRDGAERNYKRFTYLSYVLYFVGWSLALLGKLFGTGGELQHD